jgi:integrase
MSSVKVKLRKSRVDGKDGKLIVQIIHHRQTRTIPTTFRVKRSEWDEQAQQFRFDANDIGRAVQLSHMKTALTDLLERIDCIVDKCHRQKIFTVDKVVALYRGKGSGKMLFPYMKHQIKKLESNNKHTTAQKYATTLRQFSLFRQEMDIPLEHLDGRVLKKFEEHLTAKGVTMNTVSFYMRTLRAVYNKAVKEAIVPQAYPFADVYTGVAKTIKRAVGETIIQQLHTLELKPHLAFARDLFLFSFYTRGMSFVDVANLKKGDIVNGIIGYKRSKTGQHIHIKVEPCMSEIIKRYSKTNGSDDRLLPVLFRNGKPVRYDTAIRTQNQRLKVISKKLNLSAPLTTYVARHTWASIARRNGIALPVISEGMGHTSEQTTRIYLASFDRKVIDQANHKIILKVQKTKKKEPAEK